MVFRIIFNWNTDKIFKECKKSLKKLTFEFPKYLFFLAAYRFLIEQFLTTAEEYENQI